eukprot:CFRG1478T1
MCLRVFVVAEDNVSQLNKDGSESDEQSHSFGNGVRGNGFVPNSPETLHSRHRLCSFELTIEDLKRENVVLNGKMETLVSTLEKFREGEGRYREQLAVANNRIYELQKEHEMHLKNIVNKRKSISQKEKEMHTESETMRMLESMTQSLDNSRNGTKLKSVDHSLAQPLTLCADCRR